ncbi:glycosyl hydrolase family 18 protein [Paramaledivibacter caminithermalis]|uniref:Spore germination protein YaaH n=1 Tax=Paramaledivibacter caminithermalis (strain DSM 15212 / CIP 107654 / DViRD3) TaxID=1121301 RepID=A0A1M6K6T7_PARC5|nr:glycosyl hydrolase family 18 protein [Paramaledivibacter caminithermalis]SHJ54634.1 Spore germination protein YaaH [Paramaledivibacter caminithermalis DSM 15212]
MKKNNIAIAVFLSITFITLIFIIYNASMPVKPVVSITRDEKLMIKKPDSLIEYKNEDNSFIVDNDKTIYLSMDILSEKLYVKTHFDVEDNVAIITTLDKVIRFYGNTDEVKINNREANHIKPMIIKDGQPFIPIDKIKEELNIESKIIEGTNNIVIKSYLDNKLIGETSRNNVMLKKDKNIWAEIAGKLNKGDKIEIINQDNGWVRILTNEGYEGFIKEKYIKNIQEIAGAKPKVSKSIWQPEKGKILLAWESVYSKNPDTKKIKDMSGLNVISPTWIRLISPEGRLKHNIGKDYIDWAKKRGYKIWALFSNSFDPKLTDKFLNSSLARERVINDLLKLMKANDIDGINIDFENVYLKNKELLVQFIRELTPVFHDNNLVVSIDVTVIGGSDNWSRFLDRKALGEIVDYMAVMTYDEHWASSPVSGSVASLPWVERSIERILEEVPAEKLLLGVPFYTRIWIETPSNTKPNKMDVKSKAVSMNVVRNILNRNDIIKLWDKEAGQYYAVYIEDNKIHKIWVEDTKSIKLKTDLVKKYNLAGVAAWRRGFEIQEIWDVIDKNIN